MAHTTDDFLEKLVARIDIPASKQASAQRSYESIGNWFCRDGSVIKELGPEVYVQGSFALGTVIRENLNKSS